MLNAAEVAMDQAAADDKERAANRAKLYAPPRRVRASREPQQRGQGMTRAQMRATMAQAAAQDTQAGRT